MDENIGIYYPGTGSRVWELKSYLCWELSGNPINTGNCFGINDICDDVHGILYYDKHRSEVGCNLGHRIDIDCTNLQFATGWEEFKDICYLPLEDAFKSPK